MTDPRLRRQIAERTFYRVLLSVTVISLALIFAAVWSPLGEWWQWLITAAPFVWVWIVMSHSREQIIARALRDE